MRQKGIYSTPKIAALALLLACGATAVLAQSLAVDPGVRGGAAGAGGTIAGMTTNQTTDFSGFKGIFTETNNVPTTFGLGPGFDSNSCGSCHAFPAAGGSSPKTNPLFNVYQLKGATNTMPFFETTTGPVVVARTPFQSDGVTPDGHVNQLFTIAGRSDANTCAPTQPNFTALSAANNLIFRQTTPTYGGGLIEIVQNADIVANQHANSSQKQTLGITGHPNIASDGTIMRFGWKAQQRSLVSFSGEAYNIDEGVTNELSPNEINQTKGCMFHMYPEDHTNWDNSFGGSPPSDQFPSDTSMQANFMRFLAAPVPVPPTPDTTNGQTQFNTIGCVLCHTQSFTTPTSSVAALSKVTFNAFTDLLVHHMGPCLADNITQGTAKGDEFRTAPLWGVGQRVFFMHDGRTPDIVQAIEDHFCAGNQTFAASEANAVITSFNALSQTNQQAIVDFLRSL
jgi:CxxC motif-containing protein (DUF1111 family)